MHEVIEGVAQLESVRDEWSDLWKRCPNATPFQSPEWLLAWWRHIFAGGRLWTIAIREGGRLAGLLPLYLWGERFENLSLIGTGITDYNDALLEDGVPLPDFRGPWKRASLEELRECSPFFTLGNHEPCSVCPVVELPANRIDAKLKVDLHRSSNRLHRAGTVLIERTNDPGDLFKLHAARWEQKNEKGMLAAARLQSFHREVAGGFSALGILRMYRLTLNGRAAAVIYAFAHQQRWYAYLSGFDPELTKLSPGTVLLGYLIEEATREGAVEFDLLREPETYKYRLGAQDRTNFRVRLG